jgi:RND family efflux transporter MFP subunit
MPNLINSMILLCKNRLVALGLCLGLLTGASTGPVAASELNSVDGITEPFLDVTVSASVAGIITAQKFGEGDFVKEGDVILELDKKLEELETARRKLVVDNKKVDFDATEVLFKTTKAVSGEEREKKQVEYKIAAVEHDMAAEQLRRRSVASPLAGVITEVMLDVGEACQPYQPLLRIVDVRRVYFVANIEAKAAAMLKQGQPVKLEIETGAAALPVQGKISFLSPVADPASGLLKVKVLFENPEGKIRPGLAGKLSLK